MNVSISAVIEDLDTTASGVQSAIALEALVSAAFILINSKVGDLIGRKRAYVLGLLAYAVGALAMTVTQSLTAIVIFWAIIGGLGASLLLPAMQSLIHGNFDGPARKKAYALVGAAAAIGAAVGPLIGGFVTTFLSWRVGFLLEVVVIGIVLSGIGLVRDTPYTGPRGIDLVWCGVIGREDGRDRARHPRLAGGAAYAVGAFIATGAVALGSLAWWLVRRKRQGKISLLDPDLFRSPHFRLGITQQMLQQIALGGMIALPDLPADGPRVQRDAGRSIDRPLSLSMFAVAVLAGRMAGSGGRERGQVDSGWSSSAWPCFCHSSHGSTPGGTCSCHSSSRAQGSACSSAS
jgi:MFS family permease